MTRRNVPAKTVRARTLRRSLTDAETVVWNELRRGQIQCRFRRQEPIGPFIVDFVCKRHRWAFEIDGAQHFENPYDAARDRWLQSQGYTVMRFWNSEVLWDLEMVLDTIEAHIFVPHERSERF